MNPVRVRVVPVTEVRLPGWIAGLAGGALSIAYLGMGLWRHPPLGISKWWMVAVVLSAWIGGTLLSWRRTPAVARAIHDGRVLRAGPLAVRTDEALSARVARGARGYSVVFARRGAGAFLEVESEVEARRLLAMARVPWPGGGDVVLEVPHRGIRFGQRISGVVGVACALLYGIFVGGLGMGTLKGVFGITALVFGAAASFLYVFDPLLRSTLRPGAGQAPALGTTLVDAHARLHDRSPVRSDEPGPATALPARVAALASVDEDTRAWIARIDAIGAAKDAYRGDAPSAAELGTILEDASASPSARLAAARLLALRHGAGEGELRARVADEALASRVRLAITADPLEAAEALEALAPVFVAVR